ncbi:hypothetical protein BGX28_007960, partial [Mortierella sp. GBA30]
MSSQSPSAADLSIYGIIWWLMTTKRATEYVTREAYPAIFIWYSQMNAYIKKHRHATLDRFKVSAEEALEVTRQASCSSNGGFDPLHESTHPAEKRKSGELVSVTPNDHGKVPVVGEILQVTRHRVTVLSEPLASHPDIKVVMHFPRSGYIIIPVQKASL